MSAAMIAIPSIRDPHQNRRAAAVPIVRSIGILVVAVVIAALLVFLSTRLSLPRWDLDWIAYQFAGYCR
ncbi:hypothetical protein [Allorhodopirellula solitaria]|uniref:Uncharacterized protein n=1 Tax=Allorhodopirellula solitaria TaxID=2527987 RepID=A0A5C5WMQ4_9BACT|nr:hypothetical protein [Allorhodopirellula solitaria]TWT51900.1 hypothetical protein CA85_51630 [Allorhodopirellula solitaria]